MHPTTIIIAAAIAVGGLTIETIHHVPQSPWDGHPHWNQTALVAPPSGSNFVPSLSSYQVPSGYLPTLS